MLEKTAIIVLPNTFLKSTSSIGEFSIAGTASATKIINVENIAAKIPTVTTWFAFFYHKFR